MKKTSKIYLLIFLVTIVISYIMNVITGGLAMNSFMWYEKPWYFSDFYDVIGYGLNPNIYNEVATPYPPLSLLIMRLLAEVVGSKRNWQLSPLAVRTEQDAMVAFFLLFFVLIMAHLFMIHKKLNGTDLEKCLTGFVIFSSIPMIFMLCRGNTIVFASIFTAFFIFAYESDNKVVKELALISLALAFNVKLSPALLGVVLLCKKDFKKGLIEGVRCGIYAIVIFFVSFLFFDNPAQSIVSFFNNVFAWGAGSGDLIKSIDVSTTLRRIFIVVTQSTDPLFGLELSRFINKALMLIGFVGVFFEKKVYKQTMVLALIVGINSELSFAYNYVYLIIPFVLFLNEADFKKIEDVMYAIGYYLIFGCITYPVDMVTLMYDSINDKIIPTQVPIALLGVGALILWSTFAIRTVVNVKDFVLGFKKSRVIVE